MYVKKYWLYILCSGKNGTLYIGVTNDLAHRMYQRKTHLDSGFASEYNLNKLAYKEEYNNFKDALAREKCIKKWRRDWKIQLIEKDNPEWHDLSETIE